MEKEKTVSTSIRIPESLKAELERLAQCEDRTLNNLMLVALREYVRNHTQQ